MGPGPRGKVPAHRPELGEGLSPVAPLPRASDHLGGETIAGKPAKGKGDETRVRVAFRVPLRFAFDWCTDYTPQDATLEGESYQRKIVERSARRVVFDDLEETDSGWVWAREIVTLRPPNRWHMESVGSHRDVTADYVLTRLPNGRTQLELRWWRRPNSLGKRITRAQREKETTRAWKRFAKAMEGDYRESRRGRASK